jgi:hypothetical protein
MKALYRLALALTIAAVALLSPAAHAQGADLQGNWKDTSGAYLFTVGEGIPINPPSGGGGGAWMEYQANVTFTDGSALTVTDEDGNAHAVSFTITAQLHGNAAAGFQVEYGYVIRVDGFEADRGGGHLNLINNQTVLDGTWRSHNTGESGRLVLMR